MPRCPSCFSPMTRVEEDALRHHTCPNCMGTWLPRTVLLRTIRQLAADSAQRTGAQVLAAQQEIAELAATVTESNTTKTLRCTACHVDLAKDKIHPMIPVMIDRCPRCDSIWLDVGELSLIKKLWVELQTTTDPGLLAKREKIAMAMLQWDGRSKAVDDAALAAAGITEGLNILSHVLRGL